MSENKIFDLNLKILIIIILIKTVSILILNLTNNFLSEYNTPNYSVFQKLEIKVNLTVEKKKSKMSKEFFEFILNNNNKVVDEMNKIQDKNYLYYLSRLLNQKLDPNTFYSSRLTKIPLLKIYTKNIVLEKLTDVIIFKISKLYIIKEVNFFQRSLGLNSHKLDKFYEDEKYQYYIFFKNNLEMTIDSNINIISPGPKEILALDAYFYYINYDPIKLEQIRSYISKLLIEEKDFILFQDNSISQYFSEFTYLNILFKILFLILIFINLFACINLKKGIYYILLFFNINFFLANISNHYSFLSSNMLALCIWLILFKTKFYNIFFVFLTGILSFFLLYFGNLDFYITNFLLVIVSIYISHKIINSATR